MKMCINCLLMIEDEQTQCPYCGYTDSDHPMDFCHLPPRTLLSDRYIVGRPLGCGGFGVTYIAWDVKLARRVAIKEYMPGELATRTAGSRIIEVRQGCEDTYRSGKNSFIYESMRLAQVGSIPGVVPIYDCFEDEFTAYIVMEFLEGETLQQRIDRQGKIGWQECVGIFEHVLASLSAIHAAEMMHRDIAPDNIMLCSDGRVVLIDFGAARHMTTRFSRSLSTVLKIGYAPPEQYDRHGRQGPWTDIYAVGATMYHALTCTIPPDAFTRVDRDTLVNPSRLVSLPRNVNVSVLNALNLTPGKRPQSAAELADMLCGRVRAVRVPDRIKKEKVKVSNLTKTLIAVASASAAAILLLILFGIPELILPSTQAGVPEYMVRVPSVQNMELEDARGLMEKNDLRLQVSRLVYDDFFEKNVVLYQESDAGSAAYRGSVVDVVISSPGKKTVVPDVRDFSLDDALSQLRQKGFEVTYAEEHSDIHAPGTVISQSCEGGSAADAGAQIGLSVSLGPKEGKTDSGVTAAVPDVTGMSFDEARRVLLENGLYLSKSGIVTGAEESNGTVLSQNPAAKERLARGSTVSVTIAGGSLAIVPDLRYMTRNEAAAELSSLGLTYSFEEGSMEDVAEGLIYEQIPAPGRKVSERELVYCYISTAQTVAVPDCQGLEQNEAAALLLEADLSYSVERRSSATVPEGVVIRQYKYAGSKVGSGSTVILTVSSGTEEKALRSLSLSETHLDMLGGDERVLAVTARPADASCTAVGWISSDPGVAAVDRFGKVTAVSAGTAVITVASEDGSCSAVCEVTVGAQENSSAFRYSLVDGKACIIGYAGVNTSELVIPAEIDGFEVTTIANYAFSKMDGLTAVTVPEGVVSIGKQAFIECRGLRSVKLPESLTFIGEQAFKDCVVLTSVNIPSGIRRLEPGVFYDCDALTGITLHDRLEFIDYDAFAFCDSLSEVEIPRSVTYLNGGAFIGCRSLTDISVQPGNRNYASKDGVVYDTGMNKLVIFPAGRTGEYTVPDDVTMIGSSAFAGTALSAIHLHDRVWSVGDYAFADGANLRSVTLSGSMTGIGFHVFLNCLKLHELKIPEGVTVIDGGAFVSSGIRRIALPDSLRNVPEGLFAGCSIQTVYCNEGSAACDYAVDNGIATAPYDQYPG